VNLLSLAYVAFGGAMGSMCRYMVQTLFKQYATTSFPIGTFVVNIFGGFLMGAWIAIIVYLLPEKGKDMHLLGAVGFLGGFTTFSAFTIEAYLLIERGELAQSVFYIAGSVFFSLFAFFAGMWIIKTLTA
jgi:CrcB protein